MKMRTRRIHQVLILSPRTLGRDPGAGGLLVALYPAIHRKGGHRHARVISSRRRRSSRPRP